MDKNEEAIQEIADVQEEVDTLEEATEEEQETIDWKAKYDEVQARLKRAEKKLDKQKVEKKDEKLETKTDGLSDAVLDFFELKGYNDEEVEIFQNIMKRTGMTHREVVKDDYATAKIEKMRQERAVKEATPSGTRRSSNPSNDEDYWLAKYEQTGELPKDFELRSKVINRFVDKSNPNKPSWH